MWLAWFAPTSDMTRAAVGVKRNAVWLLMLGENDEENREAERQTRRLLGLKNTSDLL